MPFPSSSPRIMAPEKRDESGRESRHRADVYGFLPYDILRSICVGVLPDDDIRKSVGDELGFCSCCMGITGKPEMSVVLTIISLGTRVALAYILAPVPEIGVYGIW